MVLSLRSPPPLLSKDLKVCHFTFFFFFFFLFNVQSFLTAGVPLVHILVSYIGSFNDLIKESWILLLSKFTKSAAARAAKNTKAHVFHAYEESHAALSSAVSHPVVKLVKQAAAMTTPVVTLPLHLVSVAVDGLKRKKEKWEERKEERKRGGADKVEEEEEERKKAYRVIHIF